MNTFNKRTYESEGILGALKSTNTSNKLSELSFLFNAVTEQVGAGYWDWYIPENYEYLSPRFKEMFGYADHEMENSPESWQKILHPDDLPTVFEYFDKHVESRGKIPYECEIRYIHKQGHIIWVLCKGNVIEWDADWNPVRMIGTHLDITAQKETEQILRKSNQMFKKVEASAKIGSWELMLDESKQLYWSEETRCIHEVAPEFVPSVEAANKFYPEPYRTKVSEAVEQAIENQSSFNYKMQIVTEKGNKKWIRTLGQPEIGKDGAAERIWGVFQDITSDMEKEESLLQAKEEAERAAKAKEEFLSTMSHEIRTPLNSVIGMAYMLLQESPRQDQYERLRILKFSAENLLSLVNDILDFNKIEAGELKIEAIPFDFHYLLNSICSGLEYRAKEKRIVLKKMVDSTLPKTLIGDPTRLTQILTNLLTNAIKFTNKGTVKVEVEQLEGTEEEVLLLISVKDTGIGIPKEKQQAIFQRFSQAESSTTREFGGTGLGLSIVKRLLELMGSSIKLESKTNRGSNFYFEIRMGIHGQQLAEDNEVFLGDSIDEAEMPDLKMARILVAEDNLLNQMVIGEFLRKWNAQVTYANDGKEAMEMMVSNEYELVLMDIQMPEMDGCTVTRKLQAEHPEKFNKFNIMALTATEGMKVYEKVTAAGMVDYATKPFNPKELIAKIKRYLPQNFLTSAYQESGNKPLLFGARELMLNPKDFNTLSLQKLRTVAEFGEEFAFQYLLKVEETVNSNKNSLSQAIADSDRELLKNISHSLMGTLKQLGAQSLLNCMENTGKLLAEAKEISPKTLTEITKDCTAKIEKLLAELKAIRELVATDQGNKF